MTFSNNKNQFYKNLSIWLDNKLEKNPSKSEDIKKIWNKKRELFESKHSSRIVGQNIIRWMGEGDKNSVRNNISLLEELTGMEFPYVKEKYFGQEVKEEKKFNYQFQKLGLAFSLAAVMFSLSLNSVVDSKMISSEKLERFYSQNKKTLDTKLDIIYSKNFPEYVMGMGLKLKSPMTGNLVDVLKSVPELNQYSITDTFNSFRKTKYGSSRKHKGIDLANACGIRKEILAAGDGIVTKVDYEKGYGYWIEIDHGERVIYNNKTNQLEKGNIKTRYAHLNKRGLCISEGDSVFVGQKIANQGNSGGEYGYHLHLELLIEDEKVNPADYISFNN